MLCLYLQAPFAACRTFTAGWYRPTATFLTPSAAYGLLLNIAGIESRLYESDPKHDGSAPATLIRTGLPAVRIELGANGVCEFIEIPSDIGLPAVRIALGAPEAGSLVASLPTVQTIYQQLHNYLGGGSEKVSDPENPGETMSKEKLGLRRTKGAKYNITPVRRELLCNLRCYICLDGNDDLEDRIRRGLNGEFNAARYGIPFLGDNQFLLDRLEIVEPPQPAKPAYWFEEITEASGSRPRPHTTRLTVLINRADMSQTDSRLFAPTEAPASMPPESAWVQIGQSVNQERGRNNFPKWNKTNRG